MNLQGMGNGRTKAEYAKFLQTPFWVALSARKVASVGHCERCQSKHRLQSHHRTYPYNWFHTTLEMLEVLCRRCHEKHHGLATFTSEACLDDAAIPATAFMVVNKPVEKQRPKFTRKFTPRLRADTWANVLRLRSEKRISRKRFEYYKRLHAEGKMAEGRSLVRDSNPKMRLSTPLPPSKPYKSKWVNRGSSSN